MDISLDIPLATQPPQGEAVDWEKIVTEDEEPVDNILSLKQMRLWHETLRDSWQPERKFISYANVGVFSAPGNPPLVPDFLLSMDVEEPQDLELQKRDKSNRSYFIWEYGKAPDLTLELVSNKEGGELGSKLRDYARMGVTYYAVYDPSHFIQNRTLSCFELVNGAYQMMPDAKFTALGLQLVEWEGEFEKNWRLWLRWADLNGEVLRLDKETKAEVTKFAQTESHRADSAEERAASAEERAAALAAKLQALGVDPNEV